MKTRTKLFHLSLFTFHFSLFTSLAAFGAANEPAWTDAYRSFTKEFGATRQFANMGVGVRAFFVSHTKNSIGQPYCEYPPVWTGEGEYDWNAYDRQIGDLMMVAPEMKFVVCVDLNTPDWLRKHLRLDSFDAVELAVCYPFWRKATAQWLNDFIRYSEARYGDKILSYVLMCGSTDEWYGFPGCGYRSAHQDDRWYEWRAKKGLPFAEVPSHHSLTNASFEGVFYDPAKEQVKIDYNRFRDETVADAIIAMARVAKDAMGPRKKEIGAFYGYYYLAMNDHMAYDRLFDAPEIDFAIAPATYNDRQVGGGAGSLLMVGSLTRRGKRFLHEIDCRPHDCANPPYFPAQANRYCSNAVDHVAINLREGCHALIRHGSWWWFDMWGGFYKTPEVLTALQRFTEVAKRFCGDKSKSLADVLYVADPESIYHTTSWKAHGGPFTFHDYLWFPEKVRNVLNRTGFVADWYSWEDLKYIDLSQYKAVVFPGLFLITPEREKFLRETVLANGRTAIWFGAPGIIDGKSLDVGRVARFAGVPYGTKGVSVTKRDGRTDVFYGAFPDSRNPADIAKMRELLVNAGCHAWVDECLPVEANERLFTVHCAKGGRKTIRLPKRVAKVVDLLHDRVVGENCTEVEVEFATPDTRLFEMVR